MQLFDMIYVLLLQVLQKLTTSIDSAQFKEALEPENVSKNRVKNILPGKWWTINKYIHVGAYLLQVVHR